MNACLSILVRLFGRVKVVRAVHSLNARSPIAVSPSGISTETRVLKPVNAPFPISFRLGGSTTEVIGCECQYESKQEVISVTHWGRVSEEVFVVQYSATPSLQATPSTIWRQGWSSSWMGQYLNAVLPISVTLAGISMEARLEHSSNAPLSIFVRLAGSSMWARAEQLWKADLPISVTLLGMVTSTRDLQP